MIAARGNTNKTLLFWRIRILTFCSRYVFSSYVYSYFTREEGPSWTSRAAASLTLTDVSRPYSPDNLQKATILSEATG